MPNAPFALVANPFAPGEIDLAWHDNSNNESGFALERRVGTTGAWSVAATLPVNTTNYIDFGLISMTTYNYRLRAFNNIGDSSFVDLISVTPL